MKSKLGIVMLIPILLWTLSCAETKEVAKTKTAQGAAIGAAAGAATGAIIGAQSGKAGTGAVIGGVAGAVIGGGVGYYLDKQKKELEQIPNTEVEKKEDRLLVKMSNAVLFDVNSAALKPEASGTMNQMADVMVRYPETDILVKGHTDSTGSEKDNQDLSERRATMVKNHLIDRGVTHQRVTAMGFGETMPIASNDTPEGRAQNRRVEIEIKPQPGAGS